MNSILRQCATPLSLVSFLAVAVTGILMLLGVRGGSLGDVHEWLGVIFVAALVLHLVRNWRGVLAMLSAQRNKIIIGATGVIAAAFILISLPFGSGGHGGGFHGPGQIVHRVAAAPIEKMAPALGLTSEEAIARLQRGGVKVEGPQQSLPEIAEEQDQELPRLLNLVLSE